MGEADKKRLALAIDGLQEAARQAELAYRFAPGSYTYGALTACKSALRAVSELDALKELAGE